MIGTIWRAIRHMGHNDIGVMNPSGNGGRSSGDGQDGGSRVGSERAGEAEWSKGRDQDGGSRVGSERAGEAEWSKGREGKTEQEDVQSGMNWNSRSSL